MLSRIWNTFIQPNVEGGGLYRALQGSVGVVSENPLKFVLPEDGGRLPDGARRVSILRGDSWGGSLPGILDMVDSAFGDRFGQLVAEFDDTQWLDLWHRYEVKHEKRGEFGSQFRQMSQDRRAEVRLFLRRITALEYFGCLNPIRDALACARVQALKILDRGHYPKLFLPVLLQELPELCVDGDIAVDSVLFLEAFDGQLVADATVGSEDLVLFQPNDLPYTHSRIDAEGEENFVAAVVQQLEDRLYLFESKNFCLAGHVAMR